MLLSALRGISALQIGVDSVCHHYTTLYVVYSETSFFKHWLKRQYSRYFQNTQDVDPLSIGFTAMNWRRVKLYSEAAKKGVRYEELNSVTEPSKARNLRIKGASASSIKYRDWLHRL